MSWTNLKAAIAAAIKTNNNQEITGAVLQNTLNSIVSSVGANATFAGVATPSTSPGTPDGPVFWIAGQHGVYSNFGNEPFTVNKYELGIFTWDGSQWSFDGISLEIAEDAFDDLNLTDATPTYALDKAIDIALTKYNDGNYRMLAQLHLPSVTNEKAGLMSVEMRNLLYNLRNAGYTFAGVATSSVNPGIPNANCFYIATDAGTYTHFTNADDEALILEQNGLYVLTYDAIENNYWEYQLIKAFDDEPTLGSKNLVESGGIINFVDSLFTEREQYLSDIYSIQVDGTFGTSSSYSHAIIPVKEGYKYRIVNTHPSTLTTPTRYAFATSAISGAGASIPLVPGTVVGEIPLGKSTIVTIPIGCKFLLVNFGNSYPVDVKGFAVVDDKPAKGSDNYIKSGAVQEIENQALMNRFNLSISEVLTPAETVDNTWITHVGIRKTNNTLQYRVYEVTPGSVYVLSKAYGRGIDASYITWFDASRNFIGYDHHFYKDITSGTEYPAFAVKVPNDAAYLYLNVSKSVDAEGRFTLLKCDDEISVNDLSKEVENNRAVSAQLTVLEPVTTNEGYFISDSGTVTANSSYGYRTYDVEGGNTYTVSGAFYSGTYGLPFVLWYDSEDNFIGYSINSFTGQNDIYVNQPVVAPPNAAYAKTNYHLARSFQFDFKQVNSGIVSSQNLSDRLNAIIGSIKHNNYRAIGYNGEEIERDVEAICSTDYLPIDASVNLIIRNLWETNAFTPLAFYDNKFKFISCIPHTTTGLKHFNLTPSEIPSGACYIRCTINELQDTATFYSGIRNLAAVEASLQGINDRFGDIETALNETVLSDLLVPDEIVYGKYIHLGQIRSAKAWEINKYNGIVPGKKYAYSAYYNESVSGIYFAYFLDDNDNVISHDTFKAPDGGGSEDFVVDKVIVAPEGATKFYLNVKTQFSSRYGLKEVIGDKTINIKELENKVDSNTSAIDVLDKELKRAIKTTTKVVLSALEGDSYSRCFIVRTRYNEDKDILLSNVFNDNGLVTFYAAYVGPNYLTDAQIMSSDYRVSLHSDSTAPLRDSEQWWHLFAQHGYNIPTIDNNTDLTDDDLNSEWVDQLNRHYTIGKITDSTVYLLPVIYKRDGHDVRDWQTTQRSANITTLTHVSGATHTSSITVSGTTSQTQIRPIMSHSDRKFYADGIEVTEIGTYYCNEFKVSESQVGYDPATISTWFGEDGKPDLTRAEIMAKFTFSFIFCGAQCCMNTTIDLRREVEFSAYGAIQQQFFVDNGNYKAMFIIPKAGTVEGIERDKPFNSPSLTGSTVQIDRNASHLKDVNDPVDRLIGYLYNPNTGDYLVGMAAGLSLVSGDTVKSKRIQNCLIGEGKHHQLLRFSPPNTNKFYISALNNAVFAENDYYWPTNYFKEVNAYVSYFDPAENIGQVYWYKDGSKYVIYAHCQTQQNRLAINVPLFMEGLELSIVEKTTGTELLTDTIQNGKFFVNYTNETNYIVLVAK